MELGDYVAHLPAGCPLWVETGGAIALSGEAHLLREAIFAVRVLDWHAHNPNGKAPERMELPKPAHEVRAEQDRNAAKAKQWAARHARRNGNPTK